MFISKSKLMLVLAFVANQQISQSANQPISQSANQHKKPNRITSKIGIVAGVGLALISFYLGWKFIAKQNEIEFFIDKNKIDLKRKHPDRWIEIDQVFSMFDNTSKQKRFNLLENLINKIRDGWDPEVVTVEGITRQLGNIDINEENVASDCTVVNKAFQRIIPISTANEEFRRDLVPVLESFLILAKEKYNH